VRRRVVITGLGAVTPVGIGVKAFWQSLRDGVPGIAPITLFDPSPFPCKVAAEVRGFDPGDFLTKKGGSTIGRFSQLGVAAARMAYEDAGLPSTRDSSGFPVCFGSSTSAVRELQETMAEFAEHGMGLRSAAVMIESLAHAVTNHVAAELGLTGQTMTLGSGCASGLDVIQWSCERIRSGGVVGVLAGATDSPLSTSVLATWSAFGLLSHWPGPPAQALRPFDALSDGTVLGEGAGAFVLEDLEHAQARGARVYAEVLGHGSSSDGLHTGNLTEASLRGAVRKALRSARVEPSEIDHINTHGGGVPKYDRAETAAYQAEFGRHAYHIPVTSIKPVIGNSFSAGGALQIVAGCLTLEEQFVPPTLNHDIPDIGCDLDYVPGRGRVARVNRLLVTARAIGPTHSAVVLARLPDP
jgi:3-oxoacyl-[acyl-carrier-protein] synthase II